MYSLGTSWILKLGQSQPLQPRSGPPNKSWSTEREAGHVITRTYRHWLLPLLLYELSSCQESNTSFFFLCKQASCWEPMLMLVNRKLWAGGGEPTLPQALVQSAVFILSLLSGRDVWNQSAMLLKTRRRAVPVPGSGTDAFWGDSARHQLSHCSETRKQSVLHEQIKHSILGLVVSCQQEDWSLN